MSNGDVLPTLLGVALVAAAAAFVLLPFARSAPADVLQPSGADNLSATIDRFALYRQVLELEFDLQTGKLAADDYELQAHDLLAQAGEALRAERGTLGELDEQIEREIAAARAAFAAARSSSRTTAGAPS